MRPQNSLMLLHNSKCRNVLISNVAYKALFMFDTHKKGFYEEERPWKNLLEVYQLFLIIVC